METPHRSGFNRGSADKLAKRPYDPSVPPSHASESKAYRSGYRKGYQKTDAVGAAFDGGVVVNRGTRSSSKPLLGSSKISLFSVPSDAWVVSPVATWTGPSKGAREAMLVRALQQASASGKPILVSFFLRRSATPGDKALGADELLAYGIVQSVSGDGYDARNYVTKITSYARYTPTGPAEGSPPSDAPAVGTTYTLTSNDLASMVQYEGPPVDSGFSVTLPEEKVTKAKWPDIIAALNDLDNKLASIDAAIGTKETKTWKPKYDAFVVPWRGVAARIRTARTMRNEYSDVSVAERAIMEARASLANLIEEWNSLATREAPKKDYSTYQQGQGSKSPFGSKVKETSEPEMKAYVQEDKKQQQPVAEPGLQAFIQEEKRKEDPVVTKEDQVTTKKDDESSESGPPQVKVMSMETDKIIDGGQIVKDQLAKRNVALTTSQPSWFEENWKMLAIGALVVAGGGYAYYHFQMKPR